MGAAPLSPVQIAKKAEKQMRREKMVGAGKQYAPTLYTVLVNVHRQGLHGRDEEVAARPLVGVSSGPLRGPFCFPPAQGRGRRERRHGTGEDVVGGAAEGRPCGPALRREIDIEGGRLKATAENTDTRKKKKKRGRFWRIV
ncbi:FhaA domain-containing protein, partial [Adlercreutzia sp. DFI.6.23]|uniref:FhaA domain-containing protein n=1 Tax=Adlercreutzia sp. DFI.6.23 TaxID=2963705 RepID=UPI00210A5F2A